MKIRKLAGKIALASTIAAIALTSGSVAGFSAYAQEETQETETQETETQEADNDITGENSSAGTVLQENDSSGLTSKENSGEEANSADQAESGSSEEAEQPRQNRPAVDTMKAKDTQSEKKTEETTTKATENETQKTNGWKTVSGKKYYYVNGVKQTGWKMISGSWYYFGTDGRMRTGWQQLGKGTSNPDKNNAKHWSYFGPDGKLRTGWKEMGVGTANPDKNNKRHWSYFGENGWLRTGWQQMGVGTSNPDKNNKKHWSYFGENGWLRTGWQQMGVGTSNPDKNNAKHWSYFGTNGWLRTGWQQMGIGSDNPDKNNPLHWSYFGENGWLRTGWQKMGQGTSNPDQDEPAHFSYFGDNGWLVTGKKTIDGMSYTFDSKGWLTAGRVSLQNEKEKGQLIQDGCYTIESSKNTGYVLDVADGSVKNGAAVRSWAKNGSIAQKFQIKHLGNNIYSVKTATTIYASALDIPNGKVQSGAKIQQYSYNGNNAQKWKVVSAGNGTYTFKTVTGDKVLDIAGGKLNGGRIQLAASNGSATQKFKLTKTSGFLIRNGRKYYFNANGDKPMIGIDVSAWSETIDWEKAKADGIEFAIIRTAHRLGKIDPYGQRNMKECTRLGIPFGVYCYSYATTNSQADQEIDVLLGTLKGYNPQLGVFIDVEDTNTYTAAFGNIYSAYARRKITDITKRMVNRIQAGGYLACVYANEDYMSNVLYLNEMPNARWVAKFYTNTSSDRNLINLAGKGYKIWQFTSTGTINGVPNKGDVDLNTLIEKYW